MAFLGAENLYRGPGGGAASRLRGRREVEVEELRVMKDQLRCFMLFIMSKTVSIPRLLLFSKELAL